MNLTPRQSRRSRNSVPIDGDKLTAARTRTGLTQGQLGERAGLSQTYISALELGDRVRLGPAAYARLCDALGVSDTALLADTPEKD